MAHSDEQTASEPWMMKTLVYLTLVSAICSLSTSAMGGGVEPIVDDLNASSATVRTRAAVRLGELGDRRAVPALLASLRDSDENVRREAAKALGAIKDPKAVAVLIEAIQDKEPGVRAYAAYALGEIKDTKAVDALFDALRDPAWSVREQAAWALREMGDSRTAERVVRMLADENSDTQQVFWLLEHIEADATPALLTLLKHSKSVVRRRAVRAIVCLGGSQAFEPLLAMLNDSDVQVRLAAVNGLTSLGDERAKRPLARLAEGDRNADIRRAAAETVRGMSVERHLAAHWSFDDRNTRKAADVTRRGNDGTIRGCKVVQGRGGAGLQFGKGRYIELGSPIGFNIAGRPFTVMAWVKAEASNGVVVARGGAFCGFSLYIKDGAARFGIHRTQDGPTHIAAGKETVVGRWVHLAGVVREDRIELYVDGKHAAVTQTPGLIPGNCGQGMEIGFDVGNSPAEIVDHFQGIIDEVKVFHAGLSESEIVEQCCPKKEKPAEK